MVTSVEKETIITFNEAENECEVYTYNRKLIKKLVKHCESCPEKYKLIADDNCGGITFQLPKKLLSVQFREPISDERREFFREQAIKSGLGKDMQKKHG